VVVLTRRPEQGQELGLLLEAQGATVIHLPSLEIGPPADPAPFDEALRGLRDFAWIAFASANAVRAVAERLAALGLPSTTPLSGARVAVVGPATAQALAEAFPGISAELGPEGEEHGQALADALVRRGVTGQRILLPVSSQGRPELEQGLLAAGARVTRVVAYETRTPRGLSEGLREALARRPDVFVFASPSAAEGLADPSLRGQGAVVIGRTTEAAARRAGFDVRGVAARPSAAGLAQAVVDALAPACGPAPPPS